MSRATASSGIGAIVAEVHPINMAPGDSLNHGPTDAGGMVCLVGRTRIVFLTDIITPYMIAVLVALAQRSRLTAVFCSHTGTRGMDWRGGVELPFCHKVIEGLTVRRRDATDYYFSPRIIAALRRARPQAVISGGFSIPSLYAGLYGRACDIPLLIQSDGTARSEARLGVEQLLARRVIRRLAWGAVGNSEPAAQRFAELGFAPGRVFLAPHTTTMQPFWDVAERRQTPDPGQLRLLSVGRLIPRKGCEWLLRALAEARRGGANAYLTVVGTGSEEGRLRALAADLAVPVSWRGFVDQPELPAVYAGADAFAFPTLDDPFGMVLLEAAAAGLPLIASPHAGATDDLVRDGINGFVIDPMNTPAMAAAIQRLAEAPELRSQMGQAARAATSGRTPEAAAAGYLKAVSAAIGDRRNGLRTS
jgi:glycosyltransferase involved in cell wall biosynthesis